MDDDRESGVDGPDVGRVDLWPWRTVSLGGARLLVLLSLVAAAVLVLTGMAIVVAGGHVGTGGWAVYLHGGAERGG
jgi:hypothetical protein